MSDLYDGPELFGVPTQEQLDAQMAQARSQGWEFPEPGYIEFRCDNWQRRFWPETRCKNTIEIKTSKDEYTVAMYQEARDAMVAAGWTWGEDFDYCPEHSK